MTNQKFKRIFTTMLACILMITCCAQAIADTYVAKSSGVYASPSAKSDKLGTLKAGVEVDVIAKKSGWAMIQKNGYTGYMKSANLVEIEETGNITAYTKSASPMYKSFSTSSGKRGTIPAGEAVTVSAKAGSWAKVSYKGYSGFVKSDKLTATAPKKEESSAPSFTVPEEALTVYAAKDGAKVYNAKGKKIGTVSLNDELECTGINGEICRVVKGKKTGYMKKEDLSETKVEIPETQPEKEETKHDAITGISAYVKKDGAKIYNISGKVIGTASVNTEVTVTAIKSNVCRVSKDGSIVYMKKSDLSTEKVEVKEESKDNGVVEIAATKGYVNKDGAKVYTADGKEMGTLSLNTEITVTAYSDTLCQVTNGSTVGYMKKDDISASKVEVKEESGVVEIAATKGYVKNDGAKVYNASGDVIGNLSVNTEVTVTAYNDSLCQVTNGSTVGYMKKDDISASKVEVQVSINTSYSLKYGDSGEAVKRVQTRLKELGYFYGSIGGNYLEQTRSAVEQFQSAAKLTVNGVADYKTLEALFADNAPKFTVSSSGGSTVKAATGTAKEMDWWNSGIQRIFARGTTATITDVATGLAWREKRTGGTNHADVQPVTAADTAALKKAYGGSWSWNRRAIFVTINGVNYAASMNGMPHGSGSITNNNFNGHHCIHFTNSRTHGSNKKCNLHQNAIKKALKASL